MSRKENEKAAAAERALPVYLQTLKQSENLGEEIISDQQQVVELDRRRQSNRVARRAIRGQGKVWVMLGNEFVKVEQEKVQEWLGSDQVVLDKEIGSIRDGLKDKVSALRNLEGRELPPGFYLNAMSKHALSDIGSQAGKVTERYLEK